MPPNVRFIKPEEIHKLLDLYRYLHRDDPDLRETGNLLPLWEEIFNDPNLHYLVIEEDGMLVSSCTMAVIKNLTCGARPYGLIENVVTRKDYRNKGYGTAVLKRAVEIARGGQLLQGNALDRLEG